MQVTYNGENLPIFLENTGAPVSIQITLQFQEVKLQTRDGFTEYSQDQTNRANTDAVNASLAPGGVVP